VNNVKLLVQAEVNPTEDPEKVITAINRVFGELELEVEEELITGKGEGLEPLRKFHDLLRREMILDAARAVLLRGLRGNTITFHLNKQVAYVGHISFSQPVGESPLGPIRVEIICDDPRGLIDWLAPKTT